jgi:CBS domain-containing protein/Zn-dependent protease
MVRLTVRGVRIRATAGWLVTYLLLMVTLVLWREPPGEALGTPVQRVLAMSVVPLLAFPTLLLHELAHLVVARRLGSRVHEVDLRMIGMSRGHAMAPGGPAGEARIALAGPVASLAMGIGLLALTAVLDRNHGLELAGWVVGCIASANVILGLASLYPGHPMDGADVVHALAWRVTGSPQRAARAVGRVGVVAGWCVMLTGIAVGLRVDPTAGMWLTLLGWSLGRISRNARDHDRLLDLVSGLTVGDATQRDVAVVTPGLTLDTVVAQDRLTDGPGMFPVVRSGALVGVIDLRDIGRAGRSGTQLRVADRMRAIERVHVVTEGQRLWDAVAILERDRVNAVPVVAPDDRARLQGLVTRAAVLRLLRARARRLAPEDGRESAPEDGPDDDGTADGRAS